MEEWNHGGLRTTCLSTGGLLMLRWLEADFNCQSGSSFHQGSSRCLRDLSCPWLAYVPGSPLSLARPGITTQHRGPASPRPRSRPGQDQDQDQDQTTNTAPTNWGSQLFYEVEIPCHKWRWVGDQLQYNTITKQLKVSIQWIRLDLKRVQGTLNVKYCHGRLRFIQFSMLTATNLYMQGPILD